MDIKADQQGAATLVPPNSNHGVLLPPLSES
jgi:hypothetical protein